MESKQPFRRPLIDVAPPSDLETRAYAPQAVPIDDGAIVMAGTCKPKEGCGEKHVLRCSNGHYWRMKDPGRCDSPTCRDCWDTWRVTRGAAMALRIQAYIDANGGIGLEGPGGLYVHHVKISPPPSVPIGSSEDVSRLRAEAWEMAKRKGALGGVGVFHGWRGDWKRGWRWSPHFHFVAVSTRPFLEPGGQRGDNGWVFKNRRLEGSKLKKRFLKGGALEREVMRGVLQACIYELDHAGVVVNGNGRARHTAVWYGVLSYRVFELEQLDEDLKANLLGEVRAKCPICGSHDVEAVLDPLELALAHAWIREREIESGGGFDLAVA